MLVQFDCCSCADGLVSHVCAVNLFDGSTALHRAVEFGDNCQLVKALVTADKTCINIQNDKGLSPLHLACQLGRKKVIQLLLVSFLCVCVRGRVRACMCVYLRENVCVCGACMQ